MLQAEPLHHALPRLGRCEAASATLRSHREVAVGRENLWGWSTKEVNRFKTTDSLASFERKAPAIIKLNPGLRKKKKIWTMLFYDKVRGTDLTTRFYKLTYMPPLPSNPHWYIGWDCLVLYDSKHMDLLVLAAYQSWLLLFSWLFQPVVGPGKESFLLHAATSTTLCVCVCVPTSVCVCVLNLLFIYRKWKRHL